MSCLITLRHHGDREIERQRETSKNITHRRQLEKLYVLKDRLGWTPPPIHLTPPPNAPQYMSIAVLEFLNNLLGARNRVRIGLSYRPARLHSLAEF